MQSLAPLDGVHAQFEIPLHRPPLQLSAMVHKFPSSQYFPSGRGCRPHAPDPGSQTPSLQASPPQDFGGPPTQAPLPLHASLVVQARPSLHAVPATRGASTQAPVLGSQAALWHASPVHCVQGPLAQAPEATQASSCVQALPSSHGVSAGAVTVLQDCVASWH